MRRLTGFLAIATSIVGLFVQVTYSQNRNSITGFVFGDSRTPVARVYVELQTDFYSMVARAQTNGSGMYTFSGLPAGLYTVKVLTSGTDYEEQSKSVSLVPVSVIQGRGSVFEQVDFYLKVRPRRGSGPLASPGVLFAQDVPAEAKRLYEAGLEDLKDNGNENEAFTKLKRSIEIYPDYYYALDRLGNEYVMRGFYEPAIILLSKAIKINPRSFSSTFGLGLAEYRLNRIDQALEHFKSSVKIEKDSANGHLWMGISLHSKNNLTAALDSLLQANKLSKETVPEVHWQLARVYKDLKRYRESADELELYLKYRPDAANAAEIRKIVQVLRAKV